MEEADRRARNTAKLSECYPAFRGRLAEVLSALADQGFRPRIQEAWRSPADQEKAYRSGHSRLRYGLHNATGGGRMEALAADVLDDDRPTTPSRRYLLALAVAAADAGLETGIAWGLEAAARERVNAAVRARNIEADVRIGWDPTHVQVRGLSAAEVQRGARPDAAVVKPTTPQEEFDMDEATLRRIMREEIAAASKSDGSIGDRVRRENRAQASFLAGEPNSVYNTDTVGEPPPGDNDPD